MVKLDKDIVAKLASGVKASEILLESREELVTSVVEATQGLMNQVKACLEANDVDGAKILLSMDSKEGSKDVEEAEEESGEGEAKAELEEDEIEAEDHKEEEKKEDEDLDSIKLELQELSSYVASNVTDKSVRITLSGNIQELLRKTDSLKNNK